MNKMKLKIIKSYLRVIDNNLYIYVYIYKLFIEVLILNCYADFPYHLNLNYLFKYWIYSNIVLKISEKQVLSINLIDIFIGGSFL